MSKRRLPPQIVESAREFIPNVVNKNTKNIEDIYQIAENVLGIGGYSEVRLATHKGT